MFPVGWFPNREELLIRIRVKKNTGKVKRIAIDIFDCRDGFH